MAIENLKELDADLDIIQKLGDEPNSDNNLTSAELKEKFDEAGNIIKQYINETIVPILGDAVPKSRTVNKKPLSADIILSAADVGASPVGYVPSSVDITDTTPTKATKYYPLYATDKSGEQTVSANKDLYYYDMGTASYFNVGSDDQKGGLTLHASNGKYANITTSDGLTDDRTITFPDADGTVYTTGNKPTITDVGASGNPNLFHNWYFGNPINQRGKTEYATSGYTVDRWFTNSVSSLWISVEVKDGYLTLTHPATTVWHYFAQQCDKNQIIVGETYTFSALTNHGVLAYTFSYSGADMTRSLGYNWNFYTTQRNGNPIFGLRTNVSGATLDVYAVKLEQGSVQTLAHQDSTGAWVLNEIPDKNEELLKCIQFTADSYDTYAGKVVFHTGNKPSGSYTGNATARTIETKGDGNFVCLYCTGFIGLVGPQGANKASTASGTSFDATVTFSNGVLKLGGVGANSNGVTYYYQVI